MNEFNYQTSLRQPCVDSNPSGRTPPPAADARLRRGAVVIIAVAATLAACHRAPAPAPPAAPVVALRVHAEDGDTQSPPYPVEVAARYSTALSFRVGGKLIERRARLGDAVRRGEVVARLDSIDAQQQTSSARAALEAAQHRLKFAQQQLDRDQAQFARKLIPENQLEQTEDAYSAARAAHDEAADQFVLADNTRKYHALIADHDGLITSENADTGQVVSAGQAIYGLAWSGDTDVVLDAAASDVARMMKGQTATVTFPALSGLQFAATVREIAPAADPQSRTYHVKLTLADPGLKVRLGMIGEATLAQAAASEASRPRAPRLTIPATALFHQGTHSAVWVIRASDSTLELKPVTVRQYRERTVILDGGLADGDLIVAAGAHTVFAGERVKAVSPLFADDAPDAAAGAQQP